MYRNLRGWEIWLEFVVVREGCESVEADSSAHLGVGGSGTANDECLVFADRRFRLRSHDDCLLTYLVVENRNTTGKLLPLDLLTPRGCGLPKKFASSARASCYHRSFQKPCTKRWVAVKEYDHEE